MPRNLPGTNVVLDRFQIPGLFVMFQIVNYDISKLPLKEYHQ